MFVVLLPMWSSPYICYINTSRGALHALMLLLTFIFLLVKNYDSDRYACRQWPESQPQE